MVLAKPGHNRNSCSNLLNAGLPCLKGKNLKSLTHGPPWVTWRVCLCHWCIIRRAGPSVGWLEGYPASQAACLLESWRVCLCRWCITRRAGPSGGRLEGYAASQAACLLESWRVCLCRWCIIRRAGPSVGWLEGYAASQAASVNCRYAGLARTVCTHRILLYIWCFSCQKCHINRVGQNRIYTPYVTVYMVNSLPKIPYTHRI